MYLLDSVEFSFLECFEIYRVRVLNVIYFMLNKFCWVASHVGVNAGDDAVLDQYKGRCC